MGDDKEKPGLFRASLWARPAGLYFHRKPFNNGDYG